MHSPAGNLLVGVSEETMGHTVVHLLDRVVEVETLSLEAAQRAVPLSTFWMKLQRLCRGIPSRRYSALSHHPHHGQGIGGCGRQAAIYLLEGTLEAAAVPH